MKNVTITLDDAMATRARVEAASRGKSLSKFVRELIEREIGRDEKTDLEAMEKFLSGPAIPGAQGEERLPTRQELYDERIDELVHRYERSNLRDR
jgi:ribbon-helix-helix CopG family protein